MTPTRTPQTTQKARTRHRPCRGFTGRGDDGTDGNAGFEDDPDEDDPEIIDNPAVKRHAEDAKKHRLKAKEATERADDLQRQLDSAPGVSAINEARQEAAFYRVAVTELDDVAAAWKLRDKSLISTDAEGNTTGIDAAIKKVKQSYPHLADVPSTDDSRKRTTAVPPAPVSGGSPSNGRRSDGQKKTPRRVLDSEFPAPAPARDSQTARGAGNPVPQLVRS